MEDNTTIDEKVNTYVEERIQKLKKERATFIVIIIALVVLMFVTPFIRHAVGRSDDK